MALHQMIEDDMNTDMLDDVGGINGYQIAYTTRNATPMKTYRQRQNVKKKAKLGKENRRQSRPYDSEWH